VYNSDGSSLSDCQLVSDEGRRQLRSATSRTCVVRRTYSYYGDRCFAAAGPKLWNSLPAELRQAEISCQRFKRLLKTFLFGCWDRGALWLTVEPCLISFFTYLLTYFIVFRSTNNEGQTQSQNDNPEEDEYEKTSRKDSVYSSIDDYDSIVETSEGYTELTLMVTENQDTPADVAPLPEKETTSTDAPEPPAPRQHEYLVLISWRCRYHIVGVVVKLPTTRHWLETLANNLAITSSVSTR